MTIRSPSSNDLDHIAKKQCICNPSAVSPLERLTPDFLHRIFCELPLISIKALTFVSRVIKTNVDSYKEEPQLSNECFFNLIEQLPQDLLTIYSSFSQVWQRRIKGYNSLLIQPRHILGYIEQHLKDDYRKNDPEITARFISQQVERLIKFLDYYQLQPIGELYQLLELLFSTREKVADDSSVNMDEKFLKDSIDPIALRIAKMSGKTSKAVLKLFDDLNDHLAGIYGGMNNPTNYAVMSQQVEKLFDFINNNQLQPTRKLNKLLNVLCLRHYEIAACKNENEKLIKRSIYRVARILARKSGKMPAKIDKLLDIDLNGQLMGILNQFEYCTWHSQYSKVDRIYETNKELHAENFLKPIEELISFLNDCYSQPPPLNRLQNLLEELISTYNAFESYWEEWEVNEDLQLSIKLLAEFLDEALGKAPETSKKLILFNEDFNDIPNTSLNLLDYESLNSSDIEKLFFIEVPNYAAKRLLKLSPQNFRISLSKFPHEHFYAHIPTSILKSIKPEEEFYKPFLDWMTRRGKESPLLPEDPIGIIAAYSRDKILSFKRLACVSKTWQNAIGKIQFRLSNNC